MTKSHKGKKTKKGTRRKPMGRPRTTMTDKAIDDILRTVRLGVWPDRAARMHDVQPGTMRAHRTRDPEFAAALEKAEAVAEGTIHGQMLKHMEDKWVACAWMLERRWPQRWAKREAEVQINIENRPPPSGPPDGDWAKQFARMVEITKAIAPTERGGRNGRNGRKVNGTG